MPGWDWRFRLWLGPDPRWRDCGPRMEPYNHWRYQTFVVVQVIIQYSDVVFIALWFFCKQLLPSPHCFAGKFCWSISQSFMLTFMTQEWWVPSTPQPTEPTLSPTSKKPLGIPLYLQQYVQCHFWYIYICPHFLLLSFSTARCRVLGRYRSFCFCSPWSHPIRS